MYRSADGEIDLMCCRYSPALHPALLSTGLELAKLELTKHPRNS